MMIKQKKVFVVLKLMQISIRLFYTFQENQMEKHYKNLVDYCDVHKDIIDSPRLFERCPCCMNPYSNKYLPNLLQCGHLVCKQPQCFYESMCMVCNAKTNLRVYGFEKLFCVQIPDQKFTFAIQIQGSFITRMSQKVTKESTIEQILSKCQQAKAFIQSLPPQFCQFIINAKRFNANNKTTKLKNLSVKLYPCDSGRVNTIIVSDRMLGD